MEEVETALRKKWVTVGPDGIPVEVWKVVGRTASCWLQKFFKIFVGDSMP